MEGEVGVCNASILKTRQLEGAQPRFCARVNIPTLHLAWRLPALDAAHLSAHNSRVFHALDPKFGWQVDLIDPVEVRIVHSSRPIPVPH
jgi:hypothetical protein